jgi:hypothetical protein
MAPYKSYVLGNRSQAPGSRPHTDFVPFRLLASRTFTFLVGPEKEPIDIHINLLQSLSEPLDRLMNNGRMKESTERFAVLEEVEVDIFGLFAEFCYTRNYRAPPKAKPAEAVEGPNGTDVRMAKHNLPETSLRTNYCYRCSRSWASSMPKGQMICSNCASSPFYMYCVLCQAHGEVSKHCHGRGPVCLTCSKKPEVQKINLSKGEIAIRQRLDAKKYGAMGMSHDELRAHLKSLKPEDELSEKLVYHAKLYVFATIYMIQSLKDLCLHKLSRDLEAFDFKDDLAGEFANLFRYVYVNTSGNDDDTMGIGSELRDLVVTYAAFKAEFVVENKAFLDVLEEGGEGASAFAVFMAKRI